MSDEWVDFDQDEIEAEMERQEAHELSPAGIAEQNRYMLKRQRDFRLAADAVTAAWSGHAQVEAVSLIGSVASPLRKEVPRFSTYRRARIAIWHECKDLDLALWVSGTTGLDALRKAKVRALTAMYEEIGVGVTSHQVDVFVLEPGTDSYLGRLCDFNRCPKHKPPCLVPGCGAERFLKQHQGFAFDPEALAPDRVIRLFDRQGGLLQKAAEAPIQEDEDGAVA